MVEIPLQVRIMQQLIVIYLARHRLARPSSRQVLKRHSHCQAGSQISELTDI